MALMQAKTESGWVEGLPAGNQAITVFKGIPFAKPPVGELRWRPPQPAEPWDGIYRAWKFGHICPQARFSSEGGNTLAAQEFYVIDHPLDEDCLYLNIWTPAKKAEEKLPVAIYIHGGGFETGYSYLNAYDGEGFAKRGVVMVTIAYRLHVFGYLSLPELAAEDAHGSTGNYGALDQIAAIQWVRRNIAAFGGDPEQITVFGQSAGGYSSEYMCATPLLAGAFQRVIMQSGGGLTRRGFRDMPLAGDLYAPSRRILELIGADSLQEARQVDSDRLVEAHLALKAESGGNPFRSCLDGYVFSEDPADYFMGGKHTVVDSMIGCTADEMRKHIAKTLDSEQRKKQAALYGKSAEAFLEAWERDADEGREKHVQDPHGESMRVGDLAWCENQAALGRNPAYLYYFSYVPPGAEKSGAHHSVEHHFVFQTLLRSHRPYGGSDFELSNQLADYWANFVKTGNPNTPESKTEWKPYTAETPQQLEIRQQPEMNTVKPGTLISFMRDVALKKYEL